MITNRSIQSVELFEEVLDEVITSAQESGVDDGSLAGVLRAHAERLEHPDTP